MLWTRRTGYITAVIDYNGAVRIQHRFGRHVVRDLCYSKGMWIWSGAGIKGRGRREISEKARRPTASSGTISTCEKSNDPAGIEPGSPWWEASMLIAQPPCPPPPPPPQLCRKKLNCIVNIAYTLAHQRNFFPRSNCARTKLKAVHDKVNTFEINLRKISLSLTAYILKGASTSCGAVAWGTYLTNPHPLDTPSLFWSHSYPHLFNYCPLANGGSVERGADYSKGWLFPRKLEWRGRVYPLGWGSPSLRSQIEGASVFYATEAKRESQRSVGKGNGEFLIPQGSVWRLGVGEFCGGSSGALQTRGIDWVSLYGTWTGLLEENGRSGKCSEGRKIRGGGGVKASSFHTRGEKANTQMELIKGVTPVLSGCPPPPHPSLNLSHYSTHYAIRGFRIRLERASQKQSSDTHKTPYDQVKRCRERKINIKASERVNVDIFTQYKRQSLLSKINSEEKKIAYATTTDTECHCRRLVYFRTLGTKIALNSFSAIHVQRSLEASLDVLLAQCHDDKDLVRRVSSRNIIGEVCLEALKASLNFFAICLCYRSQASMHVAAPSKATYVNFSSSPFAPQHTLLSHVFYSYKEHSEKSHRLPHVNYTVTTLRGRGGVVVRLLASHPFEPVSIPPVGSLSDSHTWESCRTMPLVGGFPRGSPVPPPPFCSFIGSQDLDVTVEVKQLPMEHCEHKQRGKPALKARLCRFALQGNTFSAAQHTLVVSTKKEKNIDSSGKLVPSLKLCKNLSEAGGAEKKYICRVKFTHERRAGRNEVKARRFDVFPADVFINMTGPAPLCNTLAPHNGRPTLNRRRGRAIDSAVVAAREQRALRYRLSCITSPLTKSLAESTGRPAGRCHRARSRTRKARRQSFVTHCGQLVTDQEAAVSCQVILTASSGFYTSQALRGDEDEMRYGTAPECKDVGNGISPRKLLRPVASYGAISTNENPDPFLFRFLTSPSPLPFPEGPELRAARENLLASQQDEPSLIILQATPGFSHVEIVPYDATCRWVSRGSPVPPFFIPALLHNSVTLIGSQDLAVKSPKSFNSLIVHGTMVKPAVDELLGGSAPPLFQLPGESNWGSGDVAKNPQPAELTATFPLPERGLVGYLGEDLFLLSIPLTPPPPHSGYSLHLSFARVSTKVHPSLSVLSAVQEPGRASVANEVVSRVTGFRAALVKCGHETSNQRRYDYSGGVNIVLKSTCVLRFIREKSVALDKNIETSGDHIVSGTVALSLRLLLTTAGHPAFPAPQTGWSVNTQAKSAGHFQSYTSVRAKWSYVYASGNVTATLHCMKVRGELGPVFLEVRKLYKRFPLKFLGVEEPRRSRGVDKPSLQLSRCDVMCWQHRLKDEADRSRWLRTTYLRVATLSCSSANTYSENGMPGFEPRAFCTPDRWRTNCATGDPRCSRLGRIFSSSLKGPGNSSSRCENRYIGGYPASPSCYTPARQFSTGEAAGAD
ncbi:hypothetical protein PR048_028764 [Dryococelus australis]|uniref:Uncharacterized protein n=1 Tax=Dryococelus australis TaxID=614101 RepID=A0ABQ9GE05_9NEOP|nr:hypothetical protein PR048_028764 [Dryococelus australis]